MEMDVVALLPFQPQRNLIHSFSNREDNFGENGDAGINRGIHII
jgi:hypothetical protein